MSYMTEADFDEKFNSKLLVLFLRKACNQTIGRRTTNRKRKLLTMAKNLKIREHEADAWSRYGTIISRFWVLDNDDQEGGDDEDDGSEDEDAAGDDDDVMDDVPNQDDTTTETENTDATDDEEGMSAPHHFDAPNLFQPDPSGDYFGQQDTSQVGGSSSPTMQDLKTKRTQEEWNSLIEQTTQMWISRKAELRASGLDVTTENEPDFPEYQFLMETCIEAGRQLGRQVGDGGS